MYNKYFIDKRVKQQPEITKALLKLFCQEVDIVAAARLVRVSKETVSNTYSAFRKNIVYELAKGGGCISGKEKQEASGLFDYFSEHYHHCCQAYRFRTARMMVINSFTHDLIIRDSGTMQIILDEDANQNYTNYLNKKYREGKTVFEAYSDLFSEHATEKDYETLEKETMRVLISDTNNFHQYRIKKLKHGLKANKDLHAYESYFRYITLYALTITDDLLRNLTSQDFVTEVPENMTFRERVPHKGSVYFDTLLEDNYESQIERFFETNRVEYEEKIFEFLHLWFENHPIDTKLTFEVHPLDHIISS